MCRVPFAANRLANAISLTSIPFATLASMPLWAQPPEPPAAPANKRTVQEVLVTGSRRTETVQDIPLNIAAVDDTAIEELRLDGIFEISHYVPGLTVIDRGPRNEAPDLFVRGLNTTGLGPGFTSDTVATYLGEIPVAMDLKPVDLERVEVLIGPQGTLYGQGTMGGAIRYIPQRADAGELYAEVRGDISTMAESDGVGSDLGITLNVPLIEDILAIRANVDHLEDPGFIDYNYVVRTSGVSNPEPDFSDPAEVAANLRQVEDANGEEALSGRLNLRVTPTDWLDANLWYFYQENKADGRQLNHRLSFNTGRYESGLRYEEPNDYTNELISLEVMADLGFAEATLVYGESEYEELGQRDQTDLLLDFEYGYELFPTFSAYTRETDDHDSDTFEARLTSQLDGPLQFVVGYFDYEFNQDAVSEEYTPGFDEFAVAELGGEALRPDSLEYIQLTQVEEQERALYGEISFDILPELTTTLGYRRYEFEVNNTGGFGLPLYDTVFGGADPDAIDVDLGVNEGSDEGDLFKFNIAYDVDSDNLLYFTYSEGYRNGGVNAVPECTQEQIDSDEQQLCAQADEVFIDPDTIDNYEIGYKGFAFDNSVSLNAAIYYIDWQNLQIATTTEFGSLPIIGNGSAAESKGAEVQGNWIISDHWEAAFTFAYTKANLVESAPGLVGPADAYSGSRLPGHARQSGTLNITYNTIVANDIELDVNYGLYFTGDVYNIVGGPDEGALSEDRGGEAIPGYEVHHLSATLQKDRWRLQAYIDNLYNEYYITGTRTTRRYLVDEQNGPGRQVNGFTLRSYGQYVGDPRKIGLKFSYEFY